MRLTLLLAFAALPLAASVADAAALPPDLAQAVKEYDQAQIKGDRAELERLLADEYRLVNSAGQVETKAQFVAESSDPAFHLEPFTIEQPIEQIWTDGAVMGGVATLKGVDHGQAFKARLRFSDVWARRDGRWRVIYTHAGRAPAAKP